MPAGGCMSASPPARLRALFAQDRADDSQLILDSLPRSVSLLVWKF
jgi:hypothetical protein